MFAWRATTGVILLSLAACQSPFLVFSGGALRGDEATTESFAFASSSSLLQLEVRPEGPYSVILRVSVIDDELYIDAAPSRRWHKHLREDARVRVRLDGVVYRAVAVKVEDAAIVERFLSGRVIYRLDPR